MFIQVKLLNGFNQPLWYQVPHDWDTYSLVGKLVHVPIRNRIASALVVSYHDLRPETNFSIKLALAIETFPEDTHYQKFISQLAYYYQVDPIHFIKRIRLFLSQKEIKQSIQELPAILSNKKADVTLTDEQHIVCQFLSPHITKTAYTPTVLHGVTGSGKTEVYKTLIKQVIKQNKTALLLLPEVTLAIEFEKRLTQELKNTLEIFTFHSGTSTKNKRILWHNLLKKKPMLIIGVHLPALLPIANLGLIIIDEEHEVGYQEKKHPKVNTKEAAIIKAKLHNIPIILGSATPSLTSLYNVKEKGWHFFQLKKRFAGNLPTIKTIMLADKKQRKNFWVSKPLYDAIKDRIEKKEQTIIFLNRRGFSFFVQCKACSFIFCCNMCSVSLTLHKNNSLHCHYCSLQMQLPLSCPQCKAQEDQFLKKGIGTQQVVTILESLFPQARVARADLDTSQKKKLWQQTMDDFTSGNIDILVGTQTITKGFHFPKVTLVGVLWADLNLNFPLFNAAETTLQQLIQVAGRAGREHEKSQVIIQSMTEHEIFEYLNEIDYLKFYKQELNNREMLGYPPFKRLVEIELKFDDELVLENESINLIGHLFDAQKKLNLDLQILGPAKPPVHKIKNTYSRKIYIKGSNINDIIGVFQTIIIVHYKSSIFFTPNPVT